LSDGSKDLHQQPPELVESGAHATHKGAAMAEAVDQSVTPTDIIYQTLFQNLVDEVHFWKLVRDEAGAIRTWALVDVNQVAERAWGVKREDVIGKTADEIFETATELFMPIVTKIFADQKPHSWETYFPDTKQVLRMTSSPFGEYFVTTGADVTALKQEALEQAKKNATADMAAKASEIGVWEFDFSSGGLVWNDQMSVIHGVDPNALTGTYSDWSDRLHPDDKIETIAELERCIEVDEKFERNFRIITPAGDTRIIKARAEVFDLDGVGSRVLIGTNIDVTAEQEIVAALKLAKDQATEASMVKSQFLANMSHELRTPLNAIIGFSDGIKSGLFGRVENKKIEEYVGEINAAGKVLLNLVNSILDISRIEAGKVDREVSQTDVSSVLKETADLISVLAADKNVALTLDCPESLPMIRVDAQQISQVIINLVSNAIKYTPSGGHVVCSARSPQQGTVQINIQDNGAGISEDQIKRMFEPFERGGDAVTAREQGTGLGLTLAKRLTEMNGGSISLSSERNVGTSVTVTFAAT